MKAQKFIKLRIIANKKQYLPITLEEGSFTSSIFQKLLKILFRMALLS